MVGVPGEKRFFKIASQGLRQPPPNFAGAWGVPKGSFTRSYMPPNPLDPSLGCLYGSKIECPNQLGRRKTMQIDVFRGFRGIAPMDRAQTCSGPGPRRAGPAGTGAGPVARAWRARTGRFGAILGPGTGWLGRRKTMKNRCFSGFSRDCAHGSGPNVRWSYGNTAGTFC